MFTSRSGKRPGRILCTAAFTAMLLAGCGGGGGGGGGGTHPPPPPVHRGPLYDFTPLDLPGSSFGVVDRQGIANGGLVAGTSSDAAGVPRAFFFNGKTNIDLGSLGGAGARAFAVNRCGQVTGWGQTASGIPHAFFYDGTLRDLGTLGGTRSEAADVNAVGQVVGSALLAGDTRYHAFLYDARGGAPILDLAPLSFISFAVDINEAGQVAGFSRDTEGLLRAFRVDTGSGAATFHDLGLPPGGQGSVARAINDTGTVVGYLYYLDGRQNAFLHDGTTLRELQSLGNSRFSEANAINGSGLVVGYSTPTAAGQRATAWGPGYGLVDLNERVKDLPPGTVLLSALAVADDGAIVVRTGDGLGLLRPRK